MKHLKHISAALVIIIMQIASPVTAEKISLSLSESLQYAHGGEYISAIIHMADQTDLKVATKGIFGRSKASRSRNVIRKLRSTAKAGQENLIALLEREKSLGNVLNYTSFWIFNGSVRYPRRCE